MSYRSGEECLRTSILQGSSHICLTATETYTSVYFSVLYVSCKPLRKEVLMVDVPSWQVGSSRSQLASGWHVSWALPDSCSDELRHDTSTVVLTGTPSPPPPAAAAAAASVDEDDDTGDDDDDMISSEDSSSQDVTRSPIRSSRSSTNAEIARHAMLKISTHSPPPYFSNNFNMLLYIYFHSWIFLKKFLNIYMHVELL